VIPAGKGTSFPDFPRVACRDDVSGFDYGIRYASRCELFNPNGELWKTIATFNAYRDRSTPGGRVTIWPFKRMFQTAMVDEDLTSGFSTTVSSPRSDSESECWYINSGVVDETFFTTANMAQIGR
jgi:hypothetical protein